MYKSRGRSFAAALALATAPAATMAASGSASDASSRSHLPGWNANKKKHNKYYFFRFSKTMCKVSAVIGQYRYRGKSSRGSFLGGGVTCVDCGQTLYFDPFPFGRPLY